MNPVRAWQIIMLSNLSGNPRSYHMTQFELGAWMASLTQSSADWVQSFAMQGDAKDQLIARLRATMLNMAHDLTDWLMDNTAEEEGFEAHPELDGVRSELMQIGEFGLEPISLA